MGNLQNSGSKRDQYFHKMVPHNKDDPYSSQRMNVESFYSMWDLSADLNSHTKDTEGLKLEKQGKIAY
jgi:hypothetical protein